jgi:mono/diheme cytochrome c family protein
LLKRVLIGLIVIVAIGIAGFAALAWRSSIAPVPPPLAVAFAPELVARGEALAGAGDCATCHTPKGGKLNAGGYPMPTPFGTIYSTNITPDPETGIGTWSEAAFRRAMHDGVRRDGAHLFPAFPYDHFTRMSDEDVTALYAYAMTRDPVRAPNQGNTLPFPLNVRALQAGWKLLFFHPGRFEPRPDRGPEWNRGAYLAEGISHCGACHTSRNALGAERRQAYDGAAVESWFAPPLTRANPSPAPWSEEELFAYLRAGLSQLHGTAAGPMSPVVHGLGKLAEGDIRGLAVYFAEVDQASARLAELAPAVETALAADARETGTHTDPTVRLYTAACASCHYNGGSRINPLRPDLGLNSAVSLADPTNLIRVILYGIDAAEGAPGVVMPAFAPAFSDSDVARIAVYLRATRTSQAPWPNVEKTVAAIRAEGRTP